MTDAPAQRTVHVAAVVLRDRRALLVRQTPTHSLGPVWTIPWGVLGADELPAAAAAREVREESNIVARVRGLLAVQSLPDPWKGTLALVYLCDHVEGVPAPDGIETDAAAYFSLDELTQSAEAFEPWSRWVAERSLSGYVAGLECVAGNPFGVSAGHLARRL
jgi:ADP-ribose pyrophosphatase YjhB (NUDIX family)